MMDVEISKKLYEPPQKKCMNLMHYYVVEGGPVKGKKTLVQRHSIALICSEEKCIHRNIIFRPIYMYKEHQLQ